MNIATESRLQMAARSTGRFVKPEVG